MAGQQFGVWMARPKEAKAAFAEAAADQLPYSPEPRRLLAACGVRRS